MKRRFRGGYTLIEMLITVAIFSGLLIIVLGSFASSSSSTARVSALRQRSEAARTLIDAISTDFSFLYRDEPFRDPAFGPPAGRICQMGSSGCIFHGYLVDTNRIVMALLYPGDDSDDELVRKEYVIRTIRGRTSLWLEERRGCELSGSNNWDCDNEPMVDLLPASYELNQGTSLNSGFSGITTYEALNSSSQPVTPFIKLNFVVKPLGQSCLAAEKPCYEVGTTLNVGI